MYWFAVSLVLFCAVCACEPSDHALWVPLIAYAFMAPACTAMHFYAFGLSSGFNLIEFLGGSWCVCCAAFAFHRLTFLSGRG